MEIDTEILAYYNDGHERDRLNQGPSLELLRTRILLERFLPKPPARVLDVGGASGVHASWLAECGYAVHLVDPVPLHVEQAAAIGGFTAALGDARALSEDAATYDAVLLLGPLYHLVARADRLRALGEACRVAKPGGVVAVAAISRYASTLDGYFRALVDEPGFAEVMIEDLRSGQHRNAGRLPRRFTTSYFHDRDELATEIVEVGLALEAILPIEGPLEWAPNIGDRLSVPAQRSRILDVLSAMENDAAATNVTAHMLGVGRASA